MVVYCNNESYANTLNVGRAQSPASADLRLLVLTMSMTAPEVMSVLFICKQYPVNTYVCIPDGIMGVFGRQSGEVITTFTPNVFDDWDSVKMLLEDGAGYRTYSIHDCVMSTAANFGYDKDNAMLSYMEDVVTRCLNTYSVYVVAMAIVATFENNRLVPSKFEQTVRYFSDTYKKAEMANTAYRETGSQFLSVLATANVGYFGDWTEHEDVCMHNLLLPYRPGDSVDSRSELIVKQVKSDKKNLG